MNANTAFEKLTPESEVLVEFSDNTIIAGSTFGNRKNEMFLSDERLVGGTPWSSLKDSINSFDLNANITTYSEEPWYIGFSEDDKNLFERLIAAENAQFEAGGGTQCLDTNNGLTDSYGDPCSAY